MKNLLIRNFGPIKEANIKLGQINIITGMQSSGKSCVLKTASYCSWVEKRLELTKKVNGFGNNDAFIKIMVNYYQISNYIHNDTYIEYESDYLKFYYSHALRKFEVFWKDKSWEYKRAKVSYIPAERNILAAIPKWGSIPIDANMLDFMKNWTKARNFIKYSSNFLDLGMTYSYDSVSDTDNILLKNGKPLMLKESSSGVQSLLPMYIHLDYLMNGQYEDNNENISFEKKEERNNLRALIYNKTKVEESGEPVILHNDGADYIFFSEAEANEFTSLYKKHTEIDHSEIFLEEPENNLFPPTQCKFVNWLLESIKTHNDMLFITTHSPYVLNQFIKESPEDLVVLFTHNSPEDEDLYIVKQLLEEEVQEIYDSGVDMFFNFELYV